MAITYSKRTVNPEPDGAIRIGSVRTFLDALEKLEQDLEHILFFRGHDNFSYELVPTIYRNPGWIQNEDVLFKELVLRCPNEFVVQQSTFQTLVKMQHYSLPTRLLDITSNPLIALYFACSDGHLKHESGEVLAFKVPKREVKYFDSDTVSVISNISRRPADFAMPQDKSEIKDFNEDKQIRLLLHEIKSEKPYFEGMIDPSHVESVVFVKPKLDNARIIRQDGAFLLFGITERKLVPAILPQKYVLRNPRILVMNQEKARIKQQLQALGITQSTIYPEIDRVAEHIKDSYGFSKQPLP